MRARWKNGIVHIFDASSGEGLIKCDSGKNYYVHYSAIVSKDTWKTLEERKKVKFQIVEDTTFSQVFKVKLIEEGVKL